jgi:hypothetical protein
MALINRIEIVNYLSELGAEHGGRKLAPTLACQHHQPMRRVDRHSDSQWRWQDLVD